MSARYTVRDDGDRAMLIDWRPSLSSRVAVLGSAWSEDEAGVQHLYAERDRLLALDVLEQAERR